MFIHNLKYSLKVLFKNKGLIFWTFVFPIILGTLFKMAGLDENKMYKVKELDVIDNRHSIGLSASQESVDEGSRSLRIIHRLVE